MNNEENLLTNNSNTIIIKINIKIMIKCEDYIIVLAIIFVKNNSNFSRFKRRKKKMKNIKNLLKLLAITILTTVVTSSIIGCQTNHTLTLNNQVQKDFNWLDVNNKSTINLTIYQDNISKVTIWNCMQLTTITANNLLINNDNEITKAKSPESANFLVNTLKLNATNKQEKNKTFKHSDAQKIKMKVKTYSPLISKNANHTDFIINGGTVTIYFEKNGQRLSDDYLLTIQLIQIMVLLHLNYH